MVLGDHLVGRQIVLKVLPEIGEPVFLGGEPGVEVLVPHENGPLDASVCLAYLIAFVFHLCLLDSVGFIFNYNNGCSL